MQYDDNGREVPQVELRRAAMSEGFIPADTGIKAIDDLRKRHLTALGVWRQASEVYKQVVDAQDKADREADANLVEQARTGRLPSIKAVDVAARQTERANARKVLDATNKAFDAEILAIAAGLADALPEVDRLLSERREKAREARAEAERILAAAKADLSEVNRLDQWFTRVVPGRSSKRPDFGWAMPFSDLPLPPPDAPVDLLAHRAAGEFPTV